MFSPAEPRNSSYDVTRISDINPGIMDKIRGWGDKFRDFLSKKCCSCVAIVPSFALVLLALVLVTLLIASLPLAFAITYWRPQAIRSSELKPQAVSRLHSNFGYSNKVAAPLPKPAFKDYFPSKITSCRGFGFACASDPSRVIGTNLRCDGRMDCSDNSDEYDCHECSSFSCMKSKRLLCLRGSDICNGISQCDDGSDETTYCGETCAPGQSKCSNATKCFLDKWRCDGDAHCPNADDEENCKTCNGGAKMCKTSNKCLPKWMLCNGIKDCEDGSDEMDCDCKSCSADGNVLCDGSKKLCMSIEKVCDNTPDCPGGEDEVGCAGTCLSNLVLSDRTDSVKRGSISSAPDMVKCLKDDDRLFDWRYICDGNPHRDFLLNEICDVPCTRCYSPLAFDCFQDVSASIDRTITRNVRNNVTKHRCISRSKVTFTDRFKVCDGTIDCANGADEFDCGCPHPTSISCGESSNMCFKPIQKCDGTYDCDTRFDEKNCKDCKHNAFHCAADNKCIPDRNLCDGIEDCSDGEDERNCSCDDCMRHPMKMYHCSQGLRCFRQENVCTPYTRCPNATQRDKMFCAMRDRKALSLF